MRFDAFVSYSHAADGRLAPALQRALQRFARPWNKGSALRIFRDQTDLGVNPALWSSIAKALADAKFFILLASPEAATSRWVAREVEVWRRERTNETLLILLTSGEIVWDEERNDFDWEPTNALPRALSGFFREQPRHIDLRWARSSEELSLQHSSFRDAIAEIAAPLHGKSKADLESEAVRQVRRTRRLVAIVAAVMVLLTIGASIAALFAVQNARRADQQARIAEERRRAAEARLLATEARSVLDNPEASGDLGARTLHAALLGIEATRMDPTPQAGEVLHRALSGLLLPLASFKGHEGSTIALSTDGRRMAFTTFGKIEVWNVAPPMLLATFDAADDPDIALSGDGLRLAHVEPRDKPVVLIADVGEKRQIARIELPLVPLALALDRRGTALATLDYKGPIRITDVSSGRVTRTLAPDDKVCHLRFGGGDDVLTILGCSQTVQQRRLDSGARVGVARDLSKIEDSDARTLSSVSADALRAITGDFDTVQVWDTVTLRELGRVEHGTRFVQATAVSGDGSIFAAVSRDGTLGVWRLGSSAVTALAVPRPGWTTDTFHELAITGNAQRVLFLSDRDLEIAAVGTSDEPVRLQTGRSPSVFAANADGSLIAMSDGDRQTVVWDAAARRVVATIPTEAESFGGLVTALSLSGDGKRLAVGGGFEMMAVFTTGGRRIFEFRPERGGRRITAESEMAFALDDTGARVAFVGGDRRLTIRSLDGVEPEVTRAVTEVVERLAFSADGRLLASESVDRVLRVWDARTLQERARIPHSIDVTALAFGSQGRLRVLAADGSAAEITTDHQALVAAACASVTRNFSPQEWARYFGDEPRRKTCGNLE